MNSESDQEQDTISSSSSSGESTSSASDSRNCIIASAGFVVSIAQAARARVVRWYRKHRFYGEDLRPPGHENEMSFDEFLISYHTRDDEDELTPARDRSEYISFTEIPSWPIFTPLRSCSQSCQRPAPVNVNEAPPAYDEIEPELPEYYEAVTPQKSWASPPCKPPAYTRFVVQMSTDSEDLESSAFAIL